MQSGPRDKHTEPARVQAAAQWLPGTCGAVTLFVLAACTSGQTAQLKSAPPKPFPCDLELYVSESEVQRPFERVCVVNVEESCIPGENCGSRVLQKARRRACACGADGIILKGVTRGADGTFEGIGGYGGRGVIDAVGILFTGPATTRIAPTPVPTPPPTPTPAPAPRPTPSAPTTSMKPGFRDLRWGDAPTPEMKRLTRSGALASYQRPADRLVIGAASVSSIRYYFEADRLRGVEVTLAAAQYETAVASLVEAWGPGDPLSTGGLEGSKWAAFQGTAQATEASIRRERGRQNAVLLIGVAGFESLVGKAPGTKSVEGL